MSGAREVTDADFEESVLHNDGTVLVDFWAEWCGPCRGVAPILDAMAADHAGKLDVVKVDVEANPVTAERYGITSIPALLLFKDGDVVAKLIGAKPRTLIEREFAEHLA